MKARKIEEAIVTLIYLLASAMVVLQLLGVKGLLSPLYYMTFFAVLLLWLSLSLRGFGFLDLLCVAVILLASFSSVFDMLSHGVGFAFDDLKKLIIFSITLLFLCSVGKIGVTDKNIKLILLFVDIIVCVSVLTFAFDRERMYMINGKVSSYLTFGFTNPNLGAIFLFCFAVAEIFSAINSENARHRAVHILLLFCVCAFIFMSGARNVYLALVLLVIASLYLLFTKKKKLSFSFPCALAVSVVPILFVAVYMTVLRLTSLDDVLGFLSGVGKSLDSRYEIWSEGIDIFFDSPLLGAYSVFCGADPHSQLHNTHLDILVSYGPFVLAAVCVLLALLLRGRKGSSLDKKAFFSLICFSCVIFLGIGEAALFAGSFGVYVFAALPLLCVRVNSAEASEHTDIDRALANNITP